MDSPGSVVVLDRGLVSLLLLLLVASTLLLDSDETESDLLPLSDDTDSVLLSVSDISEAEDGVVGVPLLLSLAS